MHTIAKIFVASLACYVIFLCCTYNSFSQNDNIAKDMKLKDVKQLFSTDLPKERKQLRVPKANRAVPKTHDLLASETIDMKGVLRQSNPFYILGAYPEIGEKYQSYKYSGLYRKLVAENDYCETVDFYNMADPERLLSAQNFYSDFPSAHLPRKMIMDKLGKVLVPRYNRDDKEERFKLDHRINFFHMDASIMHLYLKIGTNFLCATQMYNHIPGILHLSAKDKVVDKAHGYIQMYKERKQPQCFNKTSLFPETFRLYDKEQCEEFFTMLNSQKYKDSLKDAAIQWMVKVGFGVHKSEGVFLLDANETKKWNEEFDYGKKCGSDKRTLIAQKYVNNPLLLDLNNKFDFRVYMLIASTNPMIVYYHDGFLRVALNTYEKSSSDRATHLTNTYLANQKIKEAKDENRKINNMTEEELNDYILWSYDRFQDYLLKSKKISDPNWLDNYLRPAFHKAMVHLIRMSKDAFWKQSNVYAMHGVDFMLDDQMNLWFIESNPSPLVTGTTKWRTYYSIMAGLFDIEFAYYRSRMKRVMGVVKAMQKEAYENKVVDYNKWRGLYQEASKNRLEPEFQISKLNNFTLIMDENLPGEKAYFGNLPAECI